MNDIKTKANVGDATIIRFCQKLGFSGFSDLKIEIAKEDFSKKKEQPSSGKYHDEVAKSLIEVLQSTSCLINEEKLTKAIQLINQASSLYIFGVGSSGNTSLDLESMFLRVDSLKIAKNNGAKILAITNYIHSPIGKSADLVLQTAIEEFLNGGSLAGKISQLYICDLLVHEYEQNNKINSLDLREKVLRSIIDKRIE